MNQYNSHEGNARVCTAYRYNRIVVSLTWKSNLDLDVYVDVVLVLVLVLMLMLMLILITINFPIN